MIADTAQSLQGLEEPGEELIFGSTPEMREIRRKLELAIGDDLPLLIEGESGTGKEVTARFVHWHSARLGRPFVKVNCGALPASLLEVEMFGAGTDRPGGAEERSSAIAAATGGTLFLDEIGDLDPVLQRRLIGSMETGQFNQHHGSAQRTENARFVCASSMNLHHKAASNPALPQFVACFGHRVRLLPLRERRCDIPQLCRYISEKFATSFGRPVPSLSQAVLDDFSRRNWPGNIRELENWIARIVVFGTEEALDSEFGRQGGGRNETVARRHRATRIGLNWRKRRYT